MALYVISGVTGHVGSVTAQELISSGQSVKGIVRRPEQAADWQKRGAETAIGSLADSDFLAHTLAGADGFFALLPPDNRVGNEEFYSAQRRTAAAIAAAVQKSRVPNVVLLSSLGADLAEGTGPIKVLHYLETLLRDSGTKLAAIRACYFQENLATLIPAAIHTGTCPNFLPSADTAIPMVATKDIGRLAAQLLLAPPPRNQVVDLIGPRYSPRELCTKLGAALDKPLKIFEVPAIRHVETMVQYGFAPEIAAVYAEMYRAFQTGLITPKGNRTVNVTTQIDEVLPALLRKAQTATA